MSEIKVGSRVRYVDATGESGTYTREGNVWAVNDVLGSACVWWDGEPRPEEFLSFTYLSYLEVLPDRLLRKGDRVRIGVGCTAEDGVVTHTAMPHREMLHVQVRLDGPQPKVPVRQMGHSRITGFEDSEDMWWLASELEVLVRAPAEAQVLTEAAVRAAGWMAVAESPLAPTGTADVISQMYQRVMADDAAQMAATAPGALRFRVGDRVEGFAESRYGWQGVVVRPARMLTVEKVAVVHWDAAASGDDTESIREDRLRLISREPDGKPEAAAWVRRRMTLKGVSETVYRRGGCLSVVHNSRWETTFERDVWKEAIEPGDGTCLVTKLKTPRPPTDRVVTIKLKENVSLKNVRKHLASCGPGRLVSQLLPGACDVVVMVGEKRMLRLGPSWRVSVTNETLEWLSELGEVSVLS